MVSSTHLQSRVNCELAKLNYFIWNLNHLVTKLIMCESVSHSHMFTAENVNTQNELHLYVDNDETWLPPSLV